MLRHSSLTDAALHSMIRNGQITFGGNRQLKLYGILRCKSGRRMKKANRVFFSNNVEAIQEGYRPCSNCLHNEYLKWKTNKQADANAPV